jgi:hypothetical protein
MSLGSLSDALHVLQGESHNPRMKTLAPVLGEFFAERFVPASGGV